MQYVYSSIPMQVGTGHSFPGISLGQAIRHIRPTYFRLQHKPRHGERTRHGERIVAIYGDRQHIVPSKQTRGLF